nr:ribonuclease H-like domain-containing protein [Tanacetum cinerariifolium]
EGKNCGYNAEDMLKRKNDVKARTTLLLALPDEHQLRFSKYDSAKELWEAILKTFGRNEATKKTKKNQLKQQYEVQKRAGLNLQNMAFISSSNTSSGKSKVPTVQGASIASAQVPNVSTDVVAVSLSYDTICAFIATQLNRSPRSQDRRKSENYKKDPKVEETTPKEMIAIDGIGWDWSYMAKKDEASKNHALVADKEEIPTEYV